MSSAESCGRATASVRASRRTVARTAAPGRRCPVTEVARALAEAAAVTAAEGIVAAPLAVAVVDCGGSRSYHRMSRVPARPDMGECRGQDTDPVLWYYDDWRDKSRLTSRFGHGRACMNIPLARSGSHSLMPEHVTGGPHGRA
eukprot:1060496-Prymnesium_polylepis.1